MNGAVLITGASSGIGYELAKIFACHGHDIVLVARSSDKLNEIADELREKYKINVHVIAQDLCEDCAAQKVFENVEANHIHIDILVNNAGAGYVGYFNEIPVEKDEMTIKLNIEALTGMTKLFLNDMVKRKNGKILNVASTGSFAPGPYTAVYYASKSYVLSFSRALSVELEQYGISVSALCPGATKTNFAKSAGKKDSKISMEASYVADTAYKGLMKNKKVIIPGLRNKLFVMLPSGFVMKLIGKYQKNLSI